MSRSSQLFARVVLGSCLTVVPMGVLWTADPVAVNAPAPGCQVAAVMPRATGVAGKSAPVKIPPPTLCRWDHA